MYPYPICVLGALVETILVSWFEVLGVKVAPTKIIIDLASAQNEHKVIENQVVKMTTWLVSEILQISKNKSAMV